MSDINNTLAIHGGVPVMSMPPLLSTVGVDEAMAVSSVIEGSGVLSAFRGGRTVREFEKKFAEYIGTKYAIATTSGTTALHASVASLGLKFGDEILVPALTFISTASVVLQEGVNIVFVDVGDDYCMSPSDLESKITSRSRAIIVVHLYGQPVDMDEIMAIAKRYNLKVIEDACQSHGAEYKKQKTGSLGDIACFSFFQTKNMTTGEGGMITTSNLKLYKEIRLKREHGSPAESLTWYNYKTLGYNYNMTEMQAAVGIVQLNKLDEMNRSRRANAMYYNKTLCNIGLTLPTERKDVCHVYHNYPVLLPVELASKRDFFVEALRAEGVPVDIAYPKVLYKTKLFIDMKVKGNCPNAENITSRIFTLFTDSSINKDTIKLTRLAIVKVLAYLDIKSKCDNE